MCKRITITSNVFLASIIILTNIEDCFQSSTNHLARRKSGNGAMTKRMITFKIFKHKCSRNKVEELELIVEQNGYVFICLNEHRLTNICGYVNVSSSCRSNKKHGGFCIYLSNNFSAEFYRLMKSNILWLLVLPV